MKKAGNGDVIAGAMNMVVGDIAEKFDGGAEKLAESGAGILSTVTGTIETSLANMGKNALEILKPELKKLAKWLDGEEFQQMVEEGSEMLAKFYQGLVDVGEWVVEHKDEIKEFFVALGVAAKQIWTVLSPILAAIANFIVEHPKAFANILIALVAGMVLLNGLTGVVAIIGGIITVMDKLAPIFKKLKPFFKKIPSLLKKLTPVLKFLVTVVRKVFSVMLFLGRFLIAHPIVAAIVAIITALYLLWKHWDTVVAWTTKIWDKFVNWFKDTALADWLKEKWALIGDFISDPIGTATDVIKEKIDKLKGWFSELKESAVDVLEKIGLIDSSKVSTKVSDKKTKVDGSHRFGRSYIGHDGIYALHKGERVLTARENREYTSGKSSDGKTISVTFGDIRIEGGGANIEETADKFLKIVTRKLKEAASLSF